MMTKHTTANWQVIEVDAGYIVKSKEANYEIFIRQRNLAYLFAAATAVYPALNELLSVFSDPKAPVEQLLKATKNAKAALELVPRDARP